MTQQPTSTAGAGDAGEYEDEIEELARTQKLVCRCRIAAVDATQAEAERDQALQQLLTAMSAKQRSAGLYLQRPEAGVPREPHRAYSR